MKDVFTVIVDIIFVAYGRMTSQYTSVTDAIGHYLQDRKLHDTGHIIIKSISGNLASFDDKIGLYKDWYTHLEMV